MDGFRKADDPLEGLRYALEARLCGLFVRGRGLCRLFNGFEDLLHDFWVQYLPTVERHSDLETAFAVDPVTALGPKKLEAGGEQRPLHIRGSPQR